MDKNCLLYTSTDREIDVIEIMLQKLYTKWGITDHSPFDRMADTEYPILSDLYALIEQEYKEYDENRRQLYTAEMLQNILPVSYTHLDVYKRQVNLTRTIVQTVAR